MIKRTLHIAKNYFKRRAIILMYHRIAAPASDVWDIAVSPDHFNEQLNVLKNNFHVLSLSELVKQLKNKSIKNKSVAITFDDGSLDNFNLAKPLLEKYQLPATFFIPSGFVNEQKAFWWDVIEKVFLSTAKIPDSLSIDIDGNHYFFDFSNEEEISQELIDKHRIWKANDSLPPSKRSNCYYTVWQKLKPLPLQSIADIVYKIELWANYKSRENESYCMPLNNILELDANHLFNIESHSVNHLALAFHEKNVQEAELKNDKLYWEINLKRTPNFLAYPYGNYNQDTQNVAMNLQFEAAFTTEEKYIQKTSNLFALPRYQVKNWGGKPFEGNLRKWMG